ncbi:hypothetical protein A2697_03895 [Candidatus Curtissbacteria bacterium RIFCSPHIGHO2_01_FULL_41_44]|uniref:Probable cytosol aminopeptidase n=1 Tax=Candidatus Curtissbacteria bacterium RIFCSPLOWO2_01_FULL_42_50 TaxID=1797730 RepID=A0A1F5H808_9BACT|nr:MAG: hypothetical protein A2697_03895 [Candidatus Curtissbacteria bacterium RIFCSPHIGHO2_01_FULL_41_44]OGD94309.1 MAG: hypothetical protein A3C33_03055 [Candidatus Curtissbacteria bacterium RIFCSPHIGHO2_02_FULL_42_58]OGD97783.1 MAG: hypothetical protein A3E71_03565 [Candidatus Curtissbacteria bacterium RIFCSPHIGHO2_12_FULL_42_33]OGE00175.1 MAG: hypothetical protein A3B54_02110 [Candidatus Curtissbacteria bacterium RIFCSPLOWO2_01_FULL_42_50]OGE02101.1 MAG: hypothetical protein A3G16_00420 [Ca
MKVTVNKFNLDKITADTLVVGCWQEQGKKATPSVLGQVDLMTDGVIGRYFEKDEKFGKLFESGTFHIPPKKHKKIEKVVLVGLGKAEKLDNVKLKQVAAYIGKQHTKGVRRLAIYLPEETKVSDRVDIVVYGFASGIFDPGHHKTERNENGKSKMENLGILVDGDIAKVREKADLGLVISESIHKVREVVNLPANVCTPEYMVKFAQKIATENKLKIEVFSEKQVNQMGMNLMAAVAKGSEEDLYFVVMEYQGLPRQGFSLALVGKGITFDSGGISIKPGENMEWMKMDMAGAASVFGAMEIISRLRPKINVVAAVPLTENLPSGRASKPGDVVKGLSGKTVEIINTDAEGRLVLADALTYIQKNSKPDWIVDVATLTGAVVVSLGTWASGVLGRPQNFVDLVKEAGNTSGERLWQLPLYDEFRDQLKSYIADISNLSTVKGGGVSTGAKFLEEFVDEKVNWAHLDIAGTAWEENEKPYQTKGATGVMVATLVNLVMRLAGEK